MEYNPKINYLCCKYLSQSILMNFDEAQGKRIFQEKEEPQTEEHILMMKAKTILEIFTNMLNFNDDIVSSVYLVLSGEEINRNEKYNQFLNLLRNTLKEEYCFKNNIFIFVYVIKNKLFKAMNIEMAKILFNLVRIFKKQIPLIFYPIQTQVLVNLIDNNEEIQKINNEFYMVEARTLKFNNRHKIIKREEIIKRLINLKDKLKEMYGIFEVSMYGSYARGEENEYSDLDLIVKIDKENKGKNPNGYLFYCLSNELGILTEGKVKYADSNFEDLTIDMKRDLTLIYNENTTIKENYKNIEKEKTNDYKKFNK